MYRILIVPLQQEHSQISWRWRNDPEIWKYTGNKPSLEITPEIERDWIEGVLEDRNSKRFAITVDGLYVGNIQLTNIDQTAAQYHIFIGEKDYRVFAGGSWPTYRDFQSGQKAQSSEIQTEIDSFVVMMKMPCSPVMIALRDACAASVKLSTSSRIE